MGLFDWLSGPVIRRAQQASANTSFQVMNGNPPIYPDARLPTFISAYTGNASVYSIVTLMARKFSVIPWYNYIIQDKGLTKQYKSMHKQMHRPGFLKSSASLKTKAYKEQDESSKLSRLINRPNEYQGQDSFLFGIALYYFLCGEVFIWLNRGDTEGMDDAAIVKREILEMFILPPQYMEVIADPDNVYGIKGYRLQKDGTYTEYRPSEVIHWKMFNPVWDGGIARPHLRGVAPLAAGLKILTQDEDAVDAAVAMYQNGGPKAIITNKSNSKLTPVQESQLRDVIDEKINNKKRKAAVAVLQGEWEVHSLGANSVDMQLLEGQELTLIKLCNIFGVPPELFIKNNTYENKNQARKDLLTSLIIPACCSLRDEMNRVLTPAFGNKQNQTLDIDYGDIPELQQDLKYLVDSLVSAWWFTPNQRLKMMNEEESTDPLMNKHYIPNSLTPLDATDIDLQNENLTNIGLNDYTRTDRPDNLAAVS